MRKITLIDKILRDLLQELGYNFNIGDDGKVHVFGIVGYATGESLGVAAKVKLLRDWANSLNKEVSQLQTSAYDAQETYRKLMALTDYLGLEIVKNDEPSYTPPWYKAVPKHPQPRKRAAILEKKEKE